MKLKVYEEPSKVAPVTEMRLLYEPDGSLKLCAVNRMGEPIPGGTILSFLPGGRFRRYCAVDPGLGFERNEAGQVMELTE